MKKLYKIIGVLAAFLVLTFIIINIEGYSSYQNFIYYINKFAIENLKTIYHSGNPHKEIARDKNNINSFNQPENNIHIKININEANEYQLISLPGIGPKIAKKIINYRNTEGYFQSFDDLEKINGIGPKKLKILKNFAMIK